MKKKENKLKWFGHVSESKGEPAGKVKKKAVREAVNLEKHVDEVYLWIDEVADFLNLDQRREWAYSALRGVLHAIRDRLMPQEVFQLSAQLPLFLRGIYLEGYHFRDKPEKMHVEAFLDCISREMNPSLDINVDPADAFRAVLLVLYNHISEGELQDIYGNMPKDIKRLWHNSRQGPVL